MSGVDEAKNLSEGVPNSVVKSEGGRGFQKICSGGT